MITEVTGVLLAGGKSRRMGQDKRFLRIGDKTLIECSLGVLRSLFQTVLIVIAQDSDPLDAEVPVLRDLVPNCGSMGGLYTGLRQAATDHVFVVACDMPFLHPSVVHHLVSLRAGADIVMAEGPHGLHPTHALYGRPCLPVLEELIRTQRIKIQDMVKHPALRVRLVTQAELSPVDPEGRSFFNINCPSDLDVAEAMYLRSSDFTSSR